MAPPLSSLLPALPPDLDLLQEGLDVHLSLGALNTVVSVRCMADQALLGGHSSDPSSLI